MSWAGATKKPVQRHKKAILHTVVQWLQQNRRPGARHTVKDIERGLKTLGVSLVRGDAVFGKLRKHPNVKVVGDGFDYKPEIDNVFNKSQLRDTISRNRSGLRREALEDAYIGAKEDLKALEDEELVTKIMNKEDKQDIFYPVDSF